MPSQKNEMKKKTLRTQYIKKNVFRGNKWINKFCNSEKSKNKNLNFKSIVRNLNYYFHTFDLRDRSNIYINIFKECDK